MRLCGPAMTCYLWRRTGGEGVASCGLVSAVQAPGKVQERRPPAPPPPHTHNASPRCRFGVAAHPLASSLTWPLSAAAYYFSHKSSARMPDIYPSVTMTGTGGVCVHCSGVCVPHGLVSGDRRWCPSVNTALHTGFAQLENGCVVFKLISLSLSATPGLEVSTCPRCPGEASLIPLGVTARQLQRNYEDERN